MGSEHIYYCEIQDSLTLFWVEVKENPFSLWYPNTVELTPFILTLSSLNYDSPQRIKESERV